MITLAGCSYRDCGLLLLLNSKCWMTAGRPHQFVLVWFQWQSFHVSAYISTESLPEKQMTSIVLSLEVVRQGVQYYMRLLPPLRTPATAYSCGNPHSLIYLEWLCGESVPLGRLLAFRNIESFVRGIIPWLPPISWVGYWMRWPRSEF